MHQFLTELFFDHASALGIDTAHLPTHPQSGKFYRLPLVDKPRSNKSGWLKVITDTLAIMGNWSTGDQAIVTSRKPATESERKQWQAEAKKAQAEALIEREKQYQETALKAIEVWHNARPVQSHPYTDKKQLQPLGLRQDGYDLLIPIYSIKSAKIESIQSIRPDGSKQFMSGGRISGNAYASRKFNYETDSQIFVAEGWATSASLQQHWRVQGWHIVAFNAGNLLAVASLLRQKHPNVEIIIAGDNDISVVGQTKALETAQLIDAKILIPEFTAEERERFPKCSDWNDRWLIDNPLATLATLATQVGDHHE
jgi:putative DNA primase/helicase